MRLLIVSPFTNLHTWNKLGHWCHTRSMPNTISIDIRRSSTKDCHSSSWFHECKELEESELYKPETLLGSFKEQGIDEERCSNEKTLLVSTSILREFNFIIVCLMIDVPAGLLWNLEHLSDERSISVGAFSISWVNPERNQTAAVRARGSFREEVHTHSATASRGMNNINSIVIIVVYLKLGNTE